MAILISRVVNYEHISEYKDKEGRYVITTGKIDGIEVTLFNVYVPPGSDWTIYEHIFELMTTKAQGILICGGDFNIRLDPRIDSSNGKPDIKNFYKKINTLIQEIGFTDVWRELNPNTRDFTLYSSAHNVYSRLDYFFTFKKDLYRCSNCVIGLNTLSDHSPVYMSVFLNKTMRSSLRRLNSNILNNPIIKENLKNEIKLYLECNDNNEVTPSILWDALKAVIRGKKNCNFLFGEEEQTTET